MNIENYTKEELIKIIDDLKNEHDNLKNKIIKKINKIDLLKDEVNSYVEELSVIEEIYLNMLEQLKKNEE